MLAHHAAHEIQPAVQIDHGPAPGRLVQSVDVLSHQSLDAIFALELRQGV